MARAILGPSLDHFIHGHRQHFVGQLVHFSPLKFLGHFQQRYLAVHNLHCLDGIFHQQIQRYAGGLCQLSAIDINPCIFGAQVQGIQFAVGKRSGFGFAFGNGLIKAGEHFEHALTGGVIREGETFPAFVFDPVDFEDD